MELKKNFFDEDWYSLASMPKMANERIRTAQKTFSELAEYYIAKSDASLGFIAGLRVMIRAVERYELYLRLTGDRNFRFDPERVSVIDIERFVEYLREENRLSREQSSIFLSISAICSSPEREVKIEQRGDNLIHLRIEAMRLMWRFWNEKGLVENNPFKGFKNLKVHYGNVVYITVEEREKIAETEMPNRRLERARDIFVAQCRIGCRVSDLIRLTPAHIHDGMLVYVPNKTKDRGSAPREARVPVTPALQKLIDKYRGIDRQGRLFPCINPQSYNLAIKKIFTLAGILRMVEVRDSLTGESVMRPINEIASSHLARRTFVANLYNKVQDPTIIAQMSGHTPDSRAFARYRKQEDDLLRKVIESID